MWNLILITVALSVLGAWCAWMVAGIIYRHEARKQAQERERFARIAQANSESRERIVPRAAGLHSKRVS